MSDKHFWLGFSAFPGIGPIKFASLLKRFETAENAWKASPEDLAKVIGGKTSEKFEKFKSEFSPEKYIKKLKEKDVEFLLLTDREYPQLLKQIKNPPFVLYIRGKKEMLKQVQHDTEKPAIAVVGTRKITNYGKEVTEFLVRDLVGAGFTIVSGLALGIDSVAHRTTVELDGKTIAVLGSGVDLCYPAINQGLYNTIINGNGCVVSEFPLSQQPTIGSFPSRNRIIAGLSLGVLVTEGAEDSGALITADYAFKNGRKVFAVPGPITSSLSKGPHSLLSRGAKMVTSGQDIVEELGITGTKSTTSITGKKKITTDTKEEEKILKLLENEELHIDEIVRQTGFDTAKVGSLLSIMEMKGMVRDSGGGVFGLVS